MSRRAPRGSALAVGLIILSLVTLLALAGSSSAHVERLLAQNDTFRENAAFAASAGIEMAISAILESAQPETVNTHVTGHMSGTGVWFEAEVRFLGYETSLPQAPDAGVRGAHFDIVSTGHAARRAIDRQRAGVLWVMNSTAPVAASDCAPLANRHCHQRGELEWLSWQRVPIE
ncbi:MAG TPA: pilus assembly PilX N-terminal domain-containing protein [Steroidobacteraceae bacterium]|nr:pilus assembly PilX N-terminal domain-containing protein [Steroidobacteraceae bacterium]